MKDSQRKITVAERLAQCLVANGVSHVFCVPGESYLALLDALGRLGGRIRIVTCRHEAGAANMAVAYGKLTGKPGICMVTRGPGATHASIGVHTARQDSVPMILFVGQVARGMKGRDAFQEVDYAATFGNLAKLAVELDDPLRVTELASRAFAIAQQGRRGPVVVALPEDVLEEDAGPHKPETVVPARAGLGPQTLRQIGQRMEAAERPLLILGGTGWTAEALAAIAHWAQAISLPIALSFRRKDLIDNEHPCYVGDLGIGAAPALLAEIGAADLVLALGARLGEIPSQGYTLFEPRETARKLIHIHPGAEEIGRVWPASLSAVCDVAEAAHALATLAIPARDRDRPAQGHAEYIEFSSPISVGGEVNLSEIVAQLSASLPPDAILCNGAGNYAAWLHRFFRHRAFGTQLAPTSGAMGFGVPAAIAAKLLHPDRTVVAFAGDGCFLMAGQEFATAVQYGASVIIIVVDNGSYGTIRMHQEREYPGHVVATELRNPDFAAYARAFGGWGATVEKTADFPDAFRKAQAAGLPAIIHVRTALEDIAPGRTISQIRASAVAAKA